MSKLECQDIPNAFYTAECVFIRLKKVALPNVNVKEEMENATYIEHFFEIIFC